MAAVFFDLDGCLVDSTAPIARSINHALTKLGLPAQPEADLHPLIGPPLHASFSRLLPVLGGDADDAGEAVAIYRTVYPDLAQRLTTAYDGIRQVLAALADRHHVAVVTSKPKVLAIPILATLGLDVHLAATYGPELDALTEPKAVQLARALADAGVAAADAVMIGDRRHDVEAAEVVGTASIGVTWGAGDREELTRAGARHVVDRPADLLALLP